MSGKPQLRALEKNILKYRALQMILLLHQIESLKSFVLGSIRATDKVRKLTGSGVERLPYDAKASMKKAWGILVDKGVLSSDESADIQSIIDIRNQIGHSIHELVDDISGGFISLEKTSSYDYEALSRVELYRERIEREMSREFIRAVGCRELSFEEAEKTYKEELERLGRKIDRQLLERKENNA